MTFRIVYNQEYKRIIPAVLIDSRGVITEIQTSGGYETKSYTDSQVDLVTNRVIPYKIETDLGNLVGYFNLQLKPIGEHVSSQVLKQIRPAFQQFDNQISQLISIFITSNEWREDYLF